MNTQASSVIIAIILWYFLIGIYNLSYAGITKKIQKLDWKKFILETLGMLVIYIVVNVVSIQLGSTLGKLTISGINVGLLFATGYLYTRYVVKYENKDALVYAGVFALIFNMYWYILFGII